MRARFNVAYFAVAALLTIWAIALIGGCARREGDLSTQRVVTHAELPAGSIVSDAAYAEVRAEALPSLYDDFRDTLSRLGLVKWDARFDCNKFAALYIGVAQARYAAAAWHASTPAQALALAEVWYRPASSRSLHAIVLAITDQGPRYIEPQTGRELRLSAAEVASISLRKW